MPLERLGGQIQMVPGARGWQRSELGEDGRAQGIVGMTVNRRGRFSKGEAPAQGSLCSAQPAATVWENGHGVAPV